MTEPELVLFDLDGTLIDTAPDMAAALNQVLTDEGRAPLPFAAIRPHVSHGALGLLRLGFGERDGADERLRDAFLAHYRANLAGASCLFPGMDALLTGIETRGLRWGVVTNKPGWLTEPLLAGLGLDRRTAAVISGDTLAERKPHPAPLLRACADAGVDPARALYVGDAERDVAAGIAAGMPTFVALYGYIGADDRPGDWGADALLDEPGDLWPHLAERKPSPETP